MSIGLYIGNNRTSVLFVIVRGFFHSNLVDFIKSTFYKIDIKYVLTLTVECLTVPLWYKQQVTFFNPKFD